MSEHEELSQNETLYYILICITLTMFSGIFSGLTLSLFSLDTMYLRVLIRTGVAKERKRASTVLPLLERQHLTLVTLLLANASCMTALPVFLERLLNPVASLIVSVTAVLIFGEVIPQATFVKHALAVGNILAPLIWLVMGITFIISYPISKVLDAVVGHKSETLERDQLGQFLSLHGETGASGSGLLSAEVSLMRGAMLLSTKDTKDVLKATLSSAFMISSQTPLDKETIEKILLSGFSRVPVYKDEDRRHILGCLLVKSLLPLAFKCPPDPPKAGEYHLRELLRVNEQNSLQSLFEAFQTGQSHMAVVYANNGTALGIVTLEDVLEYLHSISINDEMDLQQQNPAQFDLRQKQLLSLFSTVRSSTTSSQRPLLQ